MIKLEVSKEKNGMAKIEAQGKRIDLIMETTIAVASLLEMVEENCKELPFIAEFVSMEARRIAKTKEHKVDNHRTESEPSGKRTDNPISELFNKIFGGGVILGATA